MIGYRPGHVRISDGLFNKTVYGHTIRSNGGNLIGITEAAISLGATIMELKEAARVEGVESAGKTSSGCKLYDLDELEAAWKEWRPPLETITTRGICDLWSFSIPEITEVIKSGLITPIHSIGNINYFDVYEVRTYINEMRRVRNELRHSC